MILQVNIKQLGRRRDVLAPIEYALPQKPKTLRELLHLLVAHEVSGYNKAPAVRIFSEADLKSQSQANGRIVFAPQSEERSTVDINEAETLAIQCFEDGLYRVFINDCEITELDKAINLNENTTVTILRLTMLAGRMW
jgi:hypothetical protein